MANDDYKNVGVGHLRQNINAMRKIITNLEKRLDKTESILAYLEDNNQFSSTSKQQDKTEKYFHLWIKKIEFRHKPLEYYDDFEAYVDKYGIKKIILDIMDYTGKKMSFREIDERSREYFKSL